MITTTRTEIGNSPRFGRPGMGGGWLLFFSLMLLGVGTYNQLIVMGVVEQGVERTEYAKAMAHVDSIFFFVPGIVVLLLGFWRTLKWWKLRQAQKQFPNQPWEYDYRWDRTHSHSGKMKQAFKWLGFFALLSIVFGPLNFIAFTQKKGPAYGMLLFDLIWFFFLGLGLYYLLQALKYGKTQFRYEKFPYFMGEQLNGHLLSPRPIGEFKTVQITLRCVQEELTSVRTSKGSKQVVKCFQLYSEELKIEEAGHMHENELSITFNLPRRNLENSLVYTHYRYWELEVKADTPGIDFEATFLLPVYSKYENS